MQDCKDQRRMPTELPFLTIVGFCVGPLLDEEGTYADYVGLYSNRG